MIDAQKPDHINLTTLISRLRDGKFVIPDFQREFEWQPWDIRDLLRSIFLDYYIGSLLLWKGKEENFDALSCEPIYGHHKNSNSEYIVLDGQQRLTALYYAFLAPDKPLPNRVNRAFYYLDVEKFMNEEYDRAFNYDWNSKWFKKLQFDLDAQYESHIFPLSIIGSSGWDMANWVQGYEKHWQKKADNFDDEQNSKQYVENAKSFGEHLKGITTQYQVSYIELNQDLAIDKVCDIFTQINSRGIRLDIFDLMNALIKPKGLQLKQMWRDASDKLAFAKSEKMNVYILQVMSIMKQSYCSPKYLYYLLPGQEKSMRDTDGGLIRDVLVPNIQDFKELWDKSVDSLKTSLDELQHPQEFGVTSARYLPYASILPVFSALQSSTKQLPHHQQLTAQRKIRCWYWASIFLNRYSGAVESTSARDYLDVREWIHNDKSEPDMIKDFRNRMGELDLEKQTRRGTSIYNGIFNLFVIQGARDWVTGKIPQLGDLDDHHIVPVSWDLKKNATYSIHTILNRCPLTSETNRKVINDKLPNAYLPELIESNGEKFVFGILESHFVSSKAIEILMRDPFTTADFDEFIEERKITLLAAIQNTTLNIEDV